jgi:membrane-bound acyltransferase YfiQ involved in biofilm formation
MFGKLKGWRTVLLNGLSAVASTLLLVLAYLDTVNLTSVLTPTQSLMWTIGVNVLTIVLRQVTNTPIGKKG